MKCQSQNQFPKDPQRWAEGMYICFYNHRDNGLLSEEKAGSRYEADFIIADDLGLDCILNNITGAINDPVLDQMITDNIQMDGKSAKFPTYQTKISASIFPSLPLSGALKKGEIYSYSNGAVMVAQDHIRTIYAPELTPALFSFYREVTEGQPWIAGEQVQINSTRTYNGKTYKCIQAHQTQESWNPELTVGVLWQKFEMSNDWSAGTSYAISQEVQYLGKIYICLQAHTSQIGWTPTAVPALWKLK